MNLPVEIFTEILKYLDIKDIRKMSLLSKLLLDIVIESIPTLCYHNHLLLSQLISNLNKLDSINYFRNIVYKLIKNTKNNNKKWSNILFIRFYSLYTNNKSSKKVRLLPNPKFYSLIQLHPDRIFSSEPELCINIDIPKDEYAKKIYLGFSYHNNSYNDMCNQKPIIFDIRFYVYIEDRIIKLYGDLRYVYNDSIFHNNFRGKHFFIMNKPLTRTIKCEIYKDSYLNSINKNIEITVPEKQSLTTNNLVKLGCDILGKVFLLEDENNNSFSSIIISNMGNFMGNVNKDILIPDILFGNLHELYIPTGKLLTI